MTAREVQKKTETGKGLLKTVATERLALSTRVAEVQAV